MQDTEKTGMWEIQYVGEKKVRGTQYAGKADWRLE